jgi:hypothetical protein
MPDPGGRVMAGLGSGIQHNGSRHRKRADRRSGCEGLSSALAPPTKDVTPAAGFTVGPGVAKRPCGTMVSVDRNQNPSLLFGIPTAEVDDNAILHPPFRRHTVRNPRSIQEQG